MRKIYGLSYSLIFDSSGLYTLTAASMYDYIKYWNSQKTVADEPNLYAAQDKKLLEDLNIHTYRNNYSAIYVTQIMNNVHRQLNSDKNNQISEYDVQHGVSNMLELCYYIANHFVELSHDILHAINMKIDEYKANPNTYSFENFRNYIEDHVIIPSYKAVTNIINNVLLERFSLNNLIIKNYNNNNININDINNIIDKFFKKIRFECRFFKNKYNQYLLYGSTLYHELHVKRRNVLNVFSNGIRELSNINKLDTFNLKSKVINVHIYDIQELKSDIFYAIMSDGNGIWPYLSNG